MQDQAVREEGSRQEDGDIMSTGTKHPALNTNYPNECKNSAHSENFQSPCIMFHKENISRISIFLTKIHLEE